jgi:hypothetical protein
MIQAEAEKIIFNEESSTQIPSVLLCSNKIIDLDMQPKDWRAWGKE